MPALQLLSMVMMTQMMGLVAQDCNTDKLVVYKLVFNTYWTPDVFPRQYPEWRPPAQWSKVVGFSHSDSYKLFRLGETASEAVKLFAETGDTQGMDKEPSGSAKDEVEATKVLDAVLDGIAAPPIETGSGSSKGKLFVDGNHTMVSLMSKLVPSPDWFVGVDSLNLCNNGKFVDSITVESDPMDAGTDNGFTFTSPNWPTTPQAVIFRISNTYPSHPAGSFYYPDLAALPTIASFSFVKEKEYELSEVYHTERDYQGDELLSIDHVSDKYLYTTDNDDETDLESSEDEAIVTFIPRDETDDDNEDEDDEEEDESLHGEDDDDVSDDDDNIDLDNAIAQITNEIPSFKSKSSIKSFRRSSSGYHASTSPTDFLKKKYKSKLLHKAQEKIFDKRHLYEKFMKTYNERKKQGLSKDLAKKLRRRKQRRMRHKHKRPRNCKVSEWSEWGPCSKSCGIGEATRTRTILKHPKRGGKTCPRLEGVRWCGSARNCRENYFNW